ncbi:MAG TPA: hypothetical protein ENI99_03030 [Sedimenticola sp.]|nr:hypothetical protein [Sedimenticola sp.]
MTTTIIRAPRRQRFLVVDQRVAEDERLSWAIHRLPIGYLRSLVMRAQAGAFHPRYGGGMAELRQEEEN